MKYRFSALATLLVASILLTWASPAWAADIEFNPASPRDYAMGGSSASGDFDIVSRDFDGDGDLDLAVSSDALNKVTVRLSNGDGTFAAASSYAVGNAPAGLVAADFDKDGNLDLATGNFLGGTASVLLGNGDGTFAPASPRDYATGTNTNDIVTADFDGDGNPDLATPNRSSNNLSVLLGNGDGTFDPTVNIAVGNGPSDITTVDFNKDGKLDLASANVSSSSVSIVLGNGDGTFAPATPRDYAAGSATFGITSADFDNDGNPDIAATNQSSNNVSILLGNGDGTLMAAVNYPVGNMPTRALSRDFNRDGRLDLAVTNQLADNVSVLEGNGDGTFKAAINHDVGDQPADLTGADINGDGRLDLATANHSAGTVSILLNVTGDEVPPATTPTLSQNPNENGWNNEDVTVTLDATDNEGGSGVREITYKVGNGQPVAVQVASATVPEITTEGTTTITYHATDYAGNAEQEKSLTVKLDKTGPQVNCGSADADWHKEQVNIGCTASDGVSGLSNDADAGFSLITSVPANTETANASTDSRNVTDKAGNEATAGPVSGIKVDRKTPAITLTTPPEGASYNFGESVTADYLCTDGGSGVGTCTGSVADGEAVDTGSVGGKNFSVEASDAAGNIATLTHSYAVHDGVAPETTITSSPRRFTNDTSPTFEFSGSDDVTAAEDLLFSYRVDDGAWSAYSPETSATLGGETGLPEGLHRFYVRSKDTAGNKDASVARRMFTVDTTAPTVTATSPEDGATGVSLAASVRATFSEEMRKATIRPVSFKLREKGSTTPITASVSYDPATKEATLKADLEPGTTYVAYLTTAVRDLADNRLTTNETWRFTTGQ